jgi:putative peptidoglycan lipid II flippase
VANGSPAQTGEPPTARSPQLTTNMIPTAETRLPRVFAGLLPINIAVQAMSFAAWVAFAHVLGASTATDAYVLGLSVPTLVYGIMLAAIRVGAIPGLTERAARGDGDGAQAANELVAAALVASAALTLVVTAVAVAAAPLVLRPDATLLSNTRWTIIELSPLAVLGAITGVLGAILAVRRSFAPAVAVMVLDPLFRICFTLAWGRSLGIQALIVANLLGSAAAVGVLWAMVRRSGIPLKLVRPARTAFVRSVVGVSAPLVIASSVLQINPIVDRTMAGSLGAGSITGFELGTRLVPAGLFIALVAAPLVATWSARKVEGGWPAIQASMQKALSSAASIVLPLAVIGIILRHQAVTLAFHGGAYSSHAAAQTSAVFAMCLLGLPSAVLSVIFSTLFIVQRETLVPMKLGFVNVVLNIGLNFAFRPLFGVAGIALSTTLTYAILNVLQASAARRRWGSLLPSSVAASLLGVIGSVVVAGIAAEVLVHQMPSGGSRAQALFVAIVVSGVGLLVYAAALFVGRRLFARAPHPFLELRSRAETRG